ncbi:MAG: ABC transporter permease [Fimbriimonadales bacterium]|nr:ABC transporter permease [Fimbriimonadales bacterium]
MRRSLHPTVWTLLALVLLLAANLALTPGFFHVGVRDGRLYGSLIDVLNHSSPVLLAALGMTLVIATKGVDLSVGSVVAISGAVAALMVTKGQAPLAQVAMVAIGVGLALGAWNGLLVSVLGIQPMVATLVLMVSGRGIAQLLTDGQIITFQDPGLASVAGGSVWGMPNPVMVAAAGLALVAVLARWTAFGTMVEAVGDNERAALLSGVPVRWIKLGAYLVAGVGSAVAGLIVCSFTKAADANNAGLYLELDAILAVVAGGTAMTGGRFTLLGTVVGALILQTLTTTILTKGVPVQWTLVVKAVAVLLVCLLQSEEFRAKVLARRAAA